MHKITLSKYLVKQCFEIDQSNAEILFYIRNIVATKLAECSTADPINRYLYRDELETFYIPFLGTLDRYTMWGGQCHKDCLQDHHEDANQNDTETSHEDFIRVSNSQQDCDNNVDIHSAAMDLNCNPLHHHPNHLQHSPNFRHRYKPVHSNGQLLFEIHGQYYYYYTDGHISGDEDAEFGCGNIDCQGHDQYGARHNCSQFTILL